jgi:hypothetical protein
MTFKTYPEDYSKTRPFHVEFQIKENGVKSIRLLKANYYESEVVLPFNPTGEVHPWNLGLYGDLVKTNGCICFWTEEFLRFMIDALNDKFEKEARKEFNEYKFKGN